MRATLSPLAALLPLVVFAACSSAPAAPDGGGVDSGGADLGTTPTDGGTRDAAAVDLGPAPDGATVCGAITDPIAADRVTTWSPGILADGQLHLPLGDDGLPVRTMVCATLSPGGDVQAAIDACPEGQVVLLMPGTFHTASTITLTKGVVLRGSGSEGAPTGTTIVKNGGETVLAIGTDRDGICYGGTGSALTADALKETATLTLGAGASRFTAGDLALVDELDGAEVDEGDCAYFKRVDHRSASQRVEIASVDTGAGTLTLRTPLHWTFHAGGAAHAEVTPVSSPTTRWAGIEHLRAEGGSNPGYPGQMAGGVDVSNAAMSWVKDVQTDDTIGGMHVALTGTYRCVVRDSYVHHSADYGFGHDCYGIVLRCGAADDLVENNVARYMNKPIMLNVTGGGNVVAYNYADNSWATPPEWQEVNIDTHCSFPHMELVEGNYAPHVGASNTHGNAGYMTFFRNYDSSQFAPPAVVGATGPQTGNITALQLSGGDVKMNVVGSVLGTDGVSTDYDAYDSGPSSVFELGDNGAGATDVAVTTLYRDGNYDFVHHATTWDASDTAHVLPPSLYTCRPRWWPAGSPWPWVGPDLSPMVGTLPAKDRADHL